MRFYRTGVVVIVVLLALVAAGRGADAVIEAKRRAAAELMKEGKTADAIALTKEVIKSDGENYRDHLLLARANDKLNNRAEAVEAYRRVLELLTTNDDRAVRTEVERRLKVLDAQTIKIQAAEDEFLKKLETLEREAIAAKDMRAVEHVFRLKGGVWAAQGAKDAAGFEVTANGEWQASPLVARQGATYRLRAAGRWMVGGAAPCTADGLTDQPVITGGPMGCLIVAVSGEHGKYQVVGSDGRFTAPTSGKLAFICNMRTMAERAKNTGTVYVIAWRE